MRYLAHTLKDIEEMLQAIGKPDLDALFDSIPKAIQLQRPLNIPKGASELELKQTLLQRAPVSAEKNFRGAGATAHFVPEIVSQLLLRSEWYTAYTPYQPEASQGTLQAIFEFQTLVCELLGCEIANASMYDGATAFAEALLMALRLKPASRCVLVSKGIHPEYRATAHTYLQAGGFEMIEVDLGQDGHTQLATLENKIAACKPAAIAYQTPNFLGQLENQNALITLAHQHQALAVAVNTDPIAFAVMTPPGQLGADVVVSEGLGLLGHLHLGGPGVGLFGTRQQFLRQMPGRLCGQTVDEDGKRGFVLTLSTREQHIRREKATSNICTNHGLMALAFSITLSLYGKTGLRQLAMRNLGNTDFFRKQCIENGVELLFKGPHFNETAVVRNQQDLPVVSLAPFYKEYAQAALVCTTEMHTQEDISALVQSLKGVC